VYSWLNKITLQLQDTGMLGVLRVIYGKTTSEVENYFTETCIEKFIVTATGKHTYMNRCTQPNTAIS
jgi:hypothetical protein